jgi:hypothetical protein
LNVIGGWRIEFEKNYYTSFNLKLRLPHVYPAGKHAELCAREALD